MTETEQYRSVRAKMNSGEMYVDFGPGLEQLEAERAAGKELMYDFNHTRPSETERRRELLDQLLGSQGEKVWVEPPLSVSYGSHVHMGSFVYVNFNLTLVDDADIFIGDRVMIAPNVTVSTAGHPVDPIERRDGTQFSLPVHIEDDVWIGSNVVIMPGVTIGAGSVIGAGAIVTKDVPPGVLAVGVPARVIRKVTKEDVLV